MNPNPTNPNYIKIIDLRSDTVTKPSTKMLESIQYAKIGDDVYAEDETVNALENRVARMFHKEAALFFPSGTMSNLTSILTWCPHRGSEIIVGDNSHIFLFEQAGSSQLGGVSMRTVPNLSDGTMNIDSIKLAIRDEDIHEPETRLICIENTHNACGGKVLPISFMKEIKQFVNDYHLSNKCSVENKDRIHVHLDGARIWNAITALNVQPHEISEYVDSLTVCMSKGLGCPIGSLLVGPNEFIQKARRIRKVLGGGMRQVGVIAAPCLVALDDFEKGILKHDHLRASILEQAFSEFEAFEVRDKVETNILFLNIVRFDSSWGNTCAAKISAFLKQKGVWVSCWGPFLLRLVIHRNIDSSDIDQIIQAFREVSESIVSNTEKV